VNAIEPRRQDRPAAGLDAGAFLARFEAGGNASDTRRRDAAEQLRAEGFPRRRTEAWKYTDLAPLAQLGLATRRVADPLRLLERVDLGGTALAATPRLVFVNGVVDDALTRLPDGMALDCQDTRERLARPESQPMAALNLMLNERTMRLHVPPGRDCGRLVVVMLGEGGPAAEAAHAHPSLALHLGEGARLSLLEVAHGSGVYVNNPLLEVSLRPRAHLTHVLLQDEGPEALHFSTVYASVAAGASYDSFTLGLGASLARHEVHATLEGEDGEVQVNGAQWLGGSQQGDLTSVIAHRAPACRSRQTVKNVLDERAHAVFQGRIEVARIAQKTDGYQMNQALLLSERAAIDSKPELEIYADDVKCSHGATVGALDEEQLFYLRSRGVPQAQARAMLVRAFLSEGLALIDDEVLRGVLEAAVERRWEREAR